VHAVLVVLLAIALDLALGDPPNPVHPVAWIGRVLATGRRWLCHGPPLVLLGAGAVLTVGVMMLAAGGGVAIGVLAATLGPGGIVVDAVVLKSTISPRGLAAAARSVAESLSRADLDQARARLGTHLVSRPTATLEARQVASGAIESVAENLTDALVAPVMFFLALGLPGALAYRALNTADTMIGYRQGMLEHFGKIAARLDDLANLLPARVAALTLVLAAGRRTSAAWMSMIRDHGRTASPNAGWTMSAMAGALGVTLEKPETYSLGHGRDPVTTDIERAIRLAARAAVASVLVSVAASAVITHVIR
jgi:adenosylcobinamide-phosphate synthase